ncbi:MAG TPA: ABC transporter permease [Candidatus Limnocylindrales bacterium]|nr:ABC transporter permease [Candidatus Limnocylindrales bacterium]
MRFIAIFKAVTKNWLRSRTGLFFSILFPIMLLFTFGSIFGGSSYVPSITAAFIMTNGIIGLTSTNTEFKRRGIIRRLSITPLTKADWIGGCVLSQTLLNLVLTGVMIGVGCGF